MINKTNSSRLLSLDVLRGITIAGMILVNNPGDYEHTYVPLEHSSWNGLTPTDLVFPFFMFVMGISMYLSYKKFDFKLSKQTFLKLLRRSVLLFLIGVALNWFGLFWREMNFLSGAEITFFERIWQAASDFENLRILGVLQRLALVSFFGSLLILLVKQRHIPWLIVFILLSYWILIAITNSYTASDDNIIAIVDRFIFGASHLYTETLSNGVVIPFDPEGLLSTIAGIAQVLLGFWAGKLISETKINSERIQKLFIFATIILFVGYLLSYGFPINKKIWSSSFVMVTSGLASLLLGLLIYFIDMKGKKGWSVFFESFGVNPLFLYAFSEVFGILIARIGFKFNGQWIATQDYIVSQLLNPFMDLYLSSLVYSLLFVFSCWLIGHILYKRKIFIKL